MRFDFPRRWRQLVIGPGVFLWSAFRRVVNEPDVWVGDRRLFQPFVNRGAAFLILAFDLQCDLRSLRLVPFDLLVLMHQRFVLLGVDLNFEKMRGRSGAGP